MKFGNVLVRKVHEAAFSGLLNKVLEIELLEDGILFGGMKKISYSSVKGTLTSPSRKNTVKLAFDANNLKGAGIELQFADAAGMEKFTAYILKHTSSTGGSKKPKIAQKINFDVNKARALLRRNPELRKMFNSMVPSIMSANEFWASRKHQLKTESGLTPGEVLSVQSYSSSIEAVSKRRAKYQTVTAEVMAEIFRKRPNVEKAYHKFVPHKYSQNEFFIKLILEDQYKRGEIDEKQVATMTTGRMDKEVSSFIEQKEKEAHEHNTKRLLENADPYFDLRETSGEALRGPISTREGYGLLDRSKRVVETVDNEAAVGGSTASSSGNKGDTEAQKSKHSKATTLYLLNQFNNEGSRLLGHGSKVTKLRTEDVPEKSKTGEFLHPDVQSQKSNHGVTLVPLNLANNGRMQRKSSKQEVEDMPSPRAKRIKLEAGALPPDKEATWSFNHENVFQSSSRPTFIGNRLDSKPANDMELKYHFQRCNEYLRFFWSLYQSKNNNEKLSKVVQRISEEIAILRSFTTLSQLSKQMMGKRLIHAVERHKRYTAKAAPKAQRKSIPQSKNSALSKKRSREEE